MKNKTGEFIRFGNLASQAHKIPKDPEERSFHTPPVAKGFYAFPRGFIETFLIGGVGSGSLRNGRYRKLRDKNGKPIKVAYDDVMDFINNYPNKKIAKKLHYAKPEPDEFDKDDGTFESYDDYEEYWRKNGPYEIWVENEPTRFKYGGLIWHHLFSENPIKDKEYSNYLKIVDSWVLTDMNTYLRCLNASVGTEKWCSAFKHYWGEEETGKKHNRKKSPYYNYGGIPYPCSKDHLEVYIESIQNDNKF